MLVHGNAFWAGVILLAWYLMDYGRRSLVVPYGYSFLGGLLLTAGPYLAVVLARWSDVQVQIGNFAGDRVPAWRPSVVLHQAALEIQRYRGWYFGLVTSTVPNPLLWAFQAATVAGLIALLVKSVTRARSAGGDPRGALRLLILVIGSVVIFAGFINNKVPVYMPHLVLGFSLAAGFAVSEIGRLLPKPAVVVPVLLAAYGLAGVAYYEKWYSTTKKSELTRYEDTEATLRALVPAGPKYIFASPQFWTPFHAEADTTFLSYAAAQPIDRGDTVTLAGADERRPIVVVVDEAQWLPELTTGPSQPATSWQRDWVQFIDQRCDMTAIAHGTAHGTLAAYRCSLREHPIQGLLTYIGGATEYQSTQGVLVQSAEDLSHWTRWDDPRRGPSDHPEVALSHGGLRISGTGWPGIVKMFDAEPGERYLVQALTSNTRDGDLLYLGTWQEPQVRSLAGASSSGIPGPLTLTAAPWFPFTRAFIATAPKVRILLYSEAPETDFTVWSVFVYRLRPVSSGARVEGQR
jgi:hypothetical protein